MSANIFAIQTTTSLAFNADKKLVNIDVGRFGGAGPSRFEAKTDYGSRYAYL